MSEEQKHLTSSNDDYPSTDTSRNVTFAASSAGTKSTENGVGKPSNWQLTPSATERVEPGNVVHDIERDQFQRNAPTNPDYADHHSSSPRIHRSSPKVKTGSDQNAVYMTVGDSAFEAGLDQYGSYPVVAGDNLVPARSDGTNKVYLLTDSLEATTDSGVDSPGDSKDEGKTPEKGKQHSIITIFSIWNTMMGTSILAMPWAIGQAGFSFGIVLMLLVAGIACYTAYLAVQTTEDIRFIRNLPKNTFLDISDACEYYFGKAGRIISLAFSQVSLIGASIVYYVLLSNFLFNTGEYIYYSVTKQFPQHLVLRNPNNLTQPISNILCPPADLNFNDTRKVDATYAKLWVKDRTVPAWLLIILFPLISIRSPTFLGKFTVLEFMNFFPSLTGTCSLAFFIHNALQTILRAQRHPENNARDVTIAFTFTTLTYVLMGTMFFIVFPVDKLCISDNFLDNLYTDIPVFIGRLGLLVQMSTVYPMIVYILRAQIMHAIFKSVYPSWRHVLVLHILIVGIGLLFAIVYPSIGTIIRFIGALCGFVYIFTIPPVITLLNKRTIGHETTVEPRIEGMDNLRTEYGNGKPLLRLSGDPIVTWNWRDRRTHILWWIRCVFYSIIILLGLLNFIAQFVLLGLPVRKPKITDWIVNRQ
ncbi:solute carrier family 38 (sodium-coupled neutral amino acid transporter), member 9 [Paragonimus westermani]|uniref:Solute carrier family 38 (Sodium-coupled neutral amino acid transporter), member 9 n=1 Tax=Paragonimus westermani TaxID=34504 RepID=A0A5J4NSJ1_9TREM|nr:solute carrier family 38 (sodium-coupled neutral amino acid transporter), member 9 [Paragonimus westermani]